jgi:hypothetical protein
VANPELNRTGRWTRSRRSSMRSRRSPQRSLGSVGRGSSNTIGRRSRAWASFGDAVAVAFFSFGTEGAAVLAQAADIPALGAVAWYGSDGTALSREILGDPRAAPFAVRTGCFNDPETDQCGHRRRRCPFLRHGRLRRGVARRAECRGGRHRGRRQLQAGPRHHRRLLRGRDRPDHARRCRRPCRRGVRCVGDRGGERPVRVEARGAMGWRLRDRRPPGAPASRSASPTTGSQALGVLRQLRRTRGATPVHAA